MTIALALLAAVAASATPALRSTGPAIAPAAAAVIYRCTASSGAVALQDDPCPPGQRQETRDIAAFAAPPPTGGTVAPVASGAPAVIQGADGAAITVDDSPAVVPILRMPPPLWRCTDPDGRSRLSEVYDPQPRCVPLSVLGVDLSRAPPSAATLCRTIEDDCVELGGDAACAAWDERLAAAESALRHAFSDTAATRRAERDRARAIVENDCRP